MTEPIGLLGLGAYAPERVMTNDDWAKHVDTTDEWIAARTGIRRRRIAADDETTLDLAEKAARVALDDAGLSADDIDEIIVASDTPETYCPDTAAFLQNRLGARRVPAFDLGGSGCAGFLLALDVARARIQQQDKRVLVVGVELLSRLMSWADRNTCVLFGDAGGAVVMGRGAKVVEILAASAGTDGSQAEILWVENGGTRYPFSAASAAAGDHQRIGMKGREVFREAVHHMSAAADDVLAKAGLTIDDVALVVPHQANRRIIDAVGKAVGVEPERVFVNVHDYGNTGSASVPLALWEARAAGRIAPGDLVLTAAFGAGFHWSSVLFRF
jgi:3-oxoacyl-[acyl-carrier-protein] synthase-3